MKKSILTVTILWLPFLLTGCPSQQSYLASKPPAFAKGYKDGCRSGEKYWENNLIDYKIIDPALKENPDYRDG